MSDGPEVWIRAVVKSDEGDTVKVWVLGKHGRTLAIMDRKDVLLEEPPTAPPA